MAIELKVPPAGESVTEVTMGIWLKKVGDFVQKDESIVEIDTDKVSMELPAPESGIITQILKNQGDVANVGDVIGMMEMGDAPVGGASAPAAAAPSAPATPAPAAQAQASGGHVMPAAAAAAHASGVDASQVAGSGPGGRVLKEDVQKAAAAPSAPAAPAAKASAPASAPIVTGGAGREEEVVRMTPLRRKIAEHLVHAQQTAAMLTTFNEVDMSHVMDFRKRFKEAFAKKYDIGLGFMSFFVKAAVDALKLIPAVNAEVRGDSIVYRNYMDIGVAVGGGKGLVVPVIRNAERLSFAQVEATIGDLGKRARDNKLALEELQGGTFTISNGGVYGSLMSTPILNAPQSGILGMHNIVERPIAVNGQVVIRPMMYIALSYDHRVIDGREAVTFLKRIKECVEEPERMLIEI